MFLQHFITDSEKTKGLGRKKTECYNQFCYYMHIAVQEDEGI